MVIAPIRMLARITGATFTGLLPGGVTTVDGAAPPLFNAAFSLVGQVPEPSTLLLIAVGLGILWWRLKRRP